MSSAAFLKPSIEEINKKLATPDFKKNILLVTHQILQANTYARKMLKIESEKLERAVDGLKDAIFFQSLSHKEKFKTREVYNILREQYFALKKEYEKQLGVKYSLNHKIFSPLRAIAMAKNIFVHGDLKKLRASLLRYKKDSEKFDKNLESYYFQEKIFKSKNWTAEDYSTFLQEKYTLTKQKTLLDLEKIRLDNLKLALDKQKTTIDSICQQPQAVRQIQLIAASILRKNQKFVARVQELNNHIQRISERIKHTKTQMDILELQLKLERHTTYDKVFEPKYSDKTAASLIADAILHDPHAVQLVARSSSNNLEMEKNWDLLSELDKDEIQHNQIFRDL